jgi:hypothetical protein
MGRVARYSRIASSHWISALSIDSILDQTLSLSSPKFPARASANCLNAVTNSPLGVGVRAGASGLSWRAGSQVVAAADAPGEAAQLADDWTTARPAAVVSLLVQNEPASDVTIAI